MEKLRVGVIGAGYIGKFHAEKYANMTDVALAGVVDPDASRAASVAAANRTTAFADYRELLGKVDAVSIAAPTPRHHEISRFFLAHDVDVLIEKPMTTTLAEADELIEIAEAGGRIIQVGQLERFNSAVGALKDVVSKPMFIESHRLSMFKSRCTDVSVVLDLMIHDIDIILTVVKSEVKSIHAAGIPAVSDHVDIANARLEFETGCVANVTASRISIKNERKIRLFQKNAYISVDFANHEITIIRKDGREGGIIPGMDIERRRFTQGDALDDELRAFVRAVRFREAPEVTGQMGRDALRVALSVMDQIQAANRRFLEQ
ncbi:Gfo/Idh/MocA family protein [Desulfococcus sp.]|uniref:Gfo/Idh/MocA family protein n=1 Tax=Desulfococcus sp. TaxID=2025834 RepID=UPI003593ED06